ncbi:phage tail protein [Archangium violaceum]|uniref:phage tail protein n=1 Tax=Archangium violaceum TaxID=83451 RepID=UPI0005B9D178|nr:phage tail protein [Archangium violaceum]
MSIPAGTNAAFALVTGAQGKRLDPYLGCNFLVELEGLLTGGFSQVQGLESTIEVEDFVEGGVSGYVHKVLKQTTYPNLVLSHGLTGLDMLWNWYDQTRRGVIWRRSGTIMLLDAQRLPVMWWDFKDALPVKWSGPAFDASQDTQVAIERLELVHRGLSRSLLSTVVSGGRVASPLGK